MASFSVNIVYLILDTNEVDDSQVSVEFRLSCVAADLERDYSEIYPKAMYYQNIDSSMDESALQTQMRGNFLTVSKSIFEDFANDCKNIIKESRGAIGDVDLGGTISMSAEVVYFSYNSDNTVTVTWTQQ